MAIIEAKNIKFKYPNSSKIILDDLSFKVEDGEIFLIKGMTGSGKTTLLRMLKEEIRPAGEMSGDLSINGRVGFVFQNPDNQIVTEKVWSELAFGLENMGLSNEEIRLRVAELLEYFGMTTWYDKDVAELSGGMKQLLNLAAVMGTEPDILVLDEATSMLDPISELKLLTFLRRINRDFNTTIVMCEHHVNRVKDMADRIVELKDGKLIDNPVIDEEYAANDVDRDAGGEVILEVKNLYFRYTRESEDVLKDFSLEVRKGEIYALLGGNGTGKTTAIENILGLLKPYKGKVKNKNVTAYLPQDIKLLINKETVKEQLEVVFGSEEKMNEMADFLLLADKMEMHPYDLSGGELQKLGLAIVLSRDPEVLILDEPTKGLDIEFKKEMAELLLKMKKDGKAILLVSHDIDFAKCVADRMGMLSIGEVVGESDTEAFLKNARFYRVNR